MIRIISTTQSAATDSRGLRPSAPSAPSAAPLKSNAGNGFGDKGLRTVGHTADSSSGENGATVRANPLKTNAKTDADGADEVHPPQSAPENARWRARL